MKKKKDINFRENTFDYLICVMLPARRLYLNGHQVQRIFALGVPETGFIVAIAIRGLVRVLGGSERTTPILC